MKDYRNFDPNQSGDSQKQTSQPSSNNRQAANPYEGANTNSQNAHAYQGDSHTAYQPMSHNQQAMAYASGEQSIEIDATSEATFFKNIYTWMCGGLLLTAIIAYGLANFQPWLGLLRSYGSMPLIGAFVVQFAVVWILASRIESMSVNTARTLFLVYAALTGTTFSVIALNYPGPIIFKAFISTASVYGAMAVYGLVTKRSLQGLGSFLFMGLIGLIVASVVNIFMASSMVDTVICVIGVLIFAGLTAYDHQKLRVIHATCLQDGDEDMEGKAVISGALELYLDFINLFLFIIRLLGSRD